MPSCEERLGQIGATFGAVNANTTQNITVSSNDQIRYSRSLHSSLEVSHVTCRWTK